jgi:hypothetical protein
MSQAEFWVRSADGEPWTARAGQELVGRGVRYGKLGRVGVVERAVSVMGGRSLRLHVKLTRKLTNPDPAKFKLAAK